MTNATRASKTCPTAHSIDALTAQPSLDRHVAQPTPKRMNASAAAVQLVDTDTGINGHDTP
jgi:hypothetical protein